MSDSNQILWGDEVIAITEDGDWFKGETNGNEVDGWISVTVRETSDEERFGCTIQYIEANRVFKVLN